MKPALATGPVFLWTQLTRIKATASPRNKRGSAVMILAVMTFWAMIFKVMTFVFMVRYNSTPNLAASQHRAPLCRFDIATAYDDAHKPLALNLMGTTIL